LICKPLGQLTTAIGRMLIDQSKEYAEGLFLDQIKDNNWVTQKIEILDLKLGTDERKKILKAFKNNPI
jgi:DNA polymerase elongation subunit (family B)